MRCEWSARQPPGCRLAFAPGGGTVLAAGSARQADSIMSIRPRLQRWARQTYRALRHPRHRRGNGVRAWLSRKVFIKELWRPDQPGVAGGMAAGLFVSVFPVIGQSVLAILLCIFARVNIPVAVLATWVGNPVTWVAMLPYQYRFGSAVLEWTLGWELPALVAEGQRLPRVATFAQFQAWLLGALVTGALLALVGYLLAYVLWPVLSKPVAAGVRKVRNVTQKIPLGQLRGRWQQKRVKPEVTVATDRRPKAPEPSPEALARARVPVVTPAPRLLANAQMAQRLREEAVPRDGDLERERLARDEPPERAGGSEGDLDAGEEEESEDSGPRRGA